MKKSKKILVTLLTILTIGVGAIGMASCDFFQPTESSQEQNPTESSQSEKTEKFTVTFETNGGAAVTAQQIEAGKVPQNYTSTRTGYTLVGWYTDSDLTKPYMGEAITANTTLYAKWAEAIEVNYDFNYDGAPENNVVSSLSGEKVEKPVDPVRSGGYTFAGWSTSEDGVVDVDFNATLSTSVTYYAQWTTTYVLEAEDAMAMSKGFGPWTAPEDFLYAVKDNGDTAKASNGYFVTGMYNNGCTMEFKFTSDRAITGVPFTLRLSAEVRDITIGDSDHGKKTGDLMKDTALYKVMVNENELKYGSIEFKNVPPQSETVYLPFADYTFTIDIKEGENTIKLITDNEIIQAGTMNATAPIVDCIKLNTYAALVFEKTEGNY